MKKKLLILSLAGLIPATLCQTLSAETTLSGTIEAEAIFNDDEDDTAIAVEFGVDHKVSEKADGHILFTYENDGEVEVDEAVINLHPNDTTDVVIGRQYVPFGAYDTNMITDPITLDLGETREEALLIAKKWGGVNTSAYLFKDKAEEANGDIDNFGVAIAYENETFSVGAGYLSDVVDTTVAGVNINAKVNLGNASITAEHTRLDDIANVNPSASHLELAYDLGGEKVIVATYQETSEAAGLDLPEEVYGVAFSMPIYKNTSIAAEYLNTTTYNETDDDAITLKLSYEF